ncbi:Fe(2+) transporter permease subunit FeoB [Methylocapsa aurea]|uniref:Fe(2+) transporter permease subunit FeoB n=1 Tax=Methylocapsa aurea TaxID=663610 RepID=UPI00068C0CFF|nr:Fe(2+) transporter permease subunit FeoB [Methylocapsa aurea]
MRIEFGHLKVGERGRVIGFKPGDIGHRQKLLSMGLTPGVEFTVVRVAPLGDPVEVRVRETSLTMRASEVSALSIERVGAEAPLGQSNTFKIAIIGNPNCGKSTLFNGLTGTRQRVGNWPGVTVEKKVGRYQFEDKRFEVVDLPGIYSLDAYDEATAIDERIARDYILSGDADLIIDLIDASHLERNLYLTTQLLEMKAPLVVILNIMEDARGSDAEFDVEAIQRRLACPVLAVVAAKRGEVEGLKAELRRLAEEKPRPSFAIDYPPLIDDAASELSHSISENSGANRFDVRWLAIRLLEGDAFATHQVDPAAREARERLANRIAQEAGDEADTLIANSRYRFVHALAGEALPKRAAVGRSMSDRIDGVVLNRLLGIPIFLGVMYCLFWFTVQLSRAFKPFVNQLSDTLFVEGPRQLLSFVDTPAWLTALLADGLGNGVLQVVNFVPIIGFLYLFISMLEESGYMARANFVMDRLMQALGLPGNAFVPMVIGFGCNVPAITATRTMERPRDRIVAVLMSPFISCGGRLAVYTVFAAAFFPDQGHFVIFGVYLLGIVFAMITALVMKHSLLPQELSLYAFELPSYHWPKPRNVLINAWMRVKVFVFHVGKFIIPMVLILKVLSAWGTDGSFNEKPIDRSMLAAGGRAITPVLAPMGVGQDQWPATVALLTGVLHKVAIVSTLESIYLEAKRTPLSAADRGFDIVERIKRAALTIPHNLKALVGFGDGPAHRAGTTADTLYQAAETRDHGYGHGVSSDLAPALANRFDGKIGALAYLLLLLCYPCIATTAATTRETNQRWTGFMVFWTVSLGYGAAVLFYQIGTFTSHPSSSIAWMLGVVTYFILLSAASAYIGMGNRRGPARKVATRA